VGFKSAPTGKPIWKIKTRQLFFNIKTDKIPVKYAETNIKGWVSIS